MIGNCDQLQNFQKAGPSVVFTKIWRVISYVYDFRRNWATILRVKCGLVCENYPIFPLIKAMFCTAAFSLIKNV